MQFDLRSEGTSLNLKWINNAVGKAFSEAVAAAAPDLLPTALTNHSMFHSLDENCADLYRKHPGAALALMDGLTDDAHPAEDLAERLEDLADADLSLRRDFRFKRLWALASRSGWRT